jgi:hypothetical protein
MANRKRQTGLTPGELGEMAARRDASARAGDGRTVEQELRDALAAVMALVRQYGLGDDDNETEPVVLAAEMALDRAALADAWERATKVPGFTEAVDRVRRQQGGR